MNQLKLVVPGLCGPLPDVEALQENPALASLARRLARADRSLHTGTGFHPELISLFGMNDTPVMPSAVLSLLGHELSPGNGRWLHADPVHLQADLDHAILRDSQSLDISAADAEALLEEINRHFKDDNIGLVAVDHNHWFLNVGEHVDVSTTPLHDVIGRNVNFFLPRGKGEKFVKSFMNEVQMLLHMSVVNQRREQAGLLPVNSLWLWGEGRLPAAGKSDIQHVYSNHALVKGLAVLNGASHHVVNDSRLLLEVVAEKTSSMVVLDDLFTIACYGDVYAWQKKLGEFYNNWFEPIVSHAMKQGRTVYLYPCNGVRYTINPGNRYRFYRRANIKDHIVSYEHQ